MEKRRPFPGESEHVPAPGSPEETRAQRRSVKQIDENATQEASDAQSAADAEDQAAGSPADQGGEA